MTMKTAAMMNQYGDTYTGMPNGRATTIPAGPRFSVCSSCPVATSPMLRAFRRSVTPPCLRPPLRRLPSSLVAGSRELLQNVGGPHYGCAVDPSTDPTVPADFGPAGDPP